VNITSGSSLGIREATTATSVIQREAGENVEVIFGTVIDDDMDDLLRVTVIATGFDKEDEMPDADEPGMRRTVPLDGNGPNYRYKGEDNLRHLDTPAYERRSTPLRGRKNNKEDSGDGNGDASNSGAEDAPSGPSASANASENGTRRSNIKRLRADDLNQDRPNRDQQRSRSSDDDTPAFLRKMMD
jgi:cell division protein FtsZ